MNLPCFGPVKQPLEVIGEFGEHRHHPHTPVVVMGCLARSDDETLTREVYISPRQGQRFAWDTQPAPPSQGDQQFPLRVGCCLYHLGDISSRDEHPLGWVAFDRP